MNDRVYTVRALVRQRGAIGVFRWVTFDVTQPAGIEPSRDQIRDRWFDQHGREWELNALELLGPKKAE